MEERYERQGRSQLVGSRTDPAVRLRLQTHCRRKRIFSVSSNQAAGAGHRIGGMAPLGLHRRTSLAAAPLSLEALSSPSCHSAGNSMPTGKLIWVHHSQTACRISHERFACCGTACAQSGATDLNTPQDRAEALFKRKERKEAQFVDGQKAWSEYEEQCRAVRDKTARLRALRLARERAGPERGAGPREKARFARGKSVVRSKNSEKV